MMQSILVTGGAGFIGTNLITRLLSEGFQVTSIDNLDDYYSTEIKLCNSQLYKDHPNYKFTRLDLLDKEEFFSSMKGAYDVIIHLAARPGVRFSIKYPEVTDRINIGGTRNVLSFARHNGIKKIIFASSSSIYGINDQLPWSEESDLEPISPYAKGKIKCEKLGKEFTKDAGHSFFALRFFSVYGKYARPDLAIGKFASNIIKGLPIPIYGDGSFQRDFTHVDDIVDGIILSINYEAQGFEAFNLGNTSTNSVMDVVKYLEFYIGQKANIEWLPVQEGDVPITYADITKAKKLLNYHPKVSLEEGLKSYVSHLKLK